MPLKEVSKRNMSLNLAPEINTEFEYVVQHISTVLCNTESRSFVVELAVETEAGADFYEMLSGKELTAEQIENLVRVAMSATLCRTMILIVKADRVLSGVELDLKQATRWNCFRV